MVQEIDLYFPYLVLFYGTLMTLVSHAPALKKQAYEQMDPQLLDWFYSHRILGLICVGVGGLWTLQRLFLG